VGLINLNNFDLLHLPINRCGDHDELVEELAGVMLTCGIMDEEADMLMYFRTTPMPRFR